MSTDYTITFRGHYVHVELAPGYEISPESNARQLPELVAFCKKHHCFKVLNTGKNPRRRMGTLDAYRSGLLLTSSGTHLKIACVWEDYVTDEITQFFENVSANRGVEVRFSDTLEAAHQWLDGKYLDAADGV